MHPILHCLLGPGMRGTSSDTAESVEMRISSPKSAMDKGAGTMNSPQLAYGATIIIISSFLSFALVTLAIALSTFLTTSVLLEAMSARGSESVMALRISSNVEEVKVLVSQPFFKGVQELECFVEVLQHQTIYSELTLAEVEQVANKLRPHVKRAFDEFSKANNLASAANARVSREIEANVAQQHQIRCTIRTIEGKEAELQSRINAIKMNLVDAAKQVKDARDNLSRAESTFKDAKDDLDYKTKNRDIVTGVGAGVLAIPIVGWIAGPILITVGLTALEDAVKAARGAVNSAEENVQDRERNLREKKQELEYRESELNSKKRERENKSRELDHQQRALEYKKQTQKQVLNMSEKLKYLVTATATTRGRTKVLRDEFKCIYSLDTLHQPLRELGTHFQSDTMQKSRLLSGELDLVSSIKKFRMICDTAAASTGEDYY